MTHDIDKGKVRALFLPVALLAWRACVDPLDHFWRDWLVVLSIYWIIVVLRAGSPTLPVVRVTAMAFLFAVYVQGQFPHTLTVLGFR